MTCGASLEENDKENIDIENVIKSEYFEYDRDRNENEIKSDVNQKTMEFQPHENVKHVTSESNPVSEYELLESLNNLKVNDT